MQNRINRSLIGCFLVMSLFGIYAAQAQEATITVLNPLGQRPSLMSVPMAPRPNSLDGKTIYIVSIRFVYTEPFFEELTKLLRERYPKTTWVPREKTGEYPQDDPKLWAEIKEKGDGMIHFIGH